MESHGHICSCLLVLRLSVLLALASLLYQPAMAETDHVLALGEGIYNPSLVVHGSTAYLVARATQLKWDTTGLKWIVNRAVLCSFSALDFTDVRCAPFDPWRGNYTECRWQGTAPPKQPDWEATGVDDTKLFAWPGRGLWAITGRRPPPKQHGSFDCGQPLVWQQFVVQLAAEGEVLDVERFRVQGSEAASAPAGVMWDADGEAKAKAKAAAAKAATAKAAAAKVRTALRRQLQQESSGLSRHLRVLLADAGAKPQAASSTGSAAGKATGKALTARKAVIPGPLPGRGPPTAHSSGSAVHAPSKRGQQVHGDKSAGKVGMPVAALVKPAVLPKPAQASTKQPAGTTSSSVVQKAQLAGSEEGHIKQGPMNVDAAGRKTARRRMRRRRKGGKRGGQQQQQQQQGGGEAMLRSSDSALQLQRQAGKLQAAQQGVERLPKQQQQRHRRRRKQRRQQGGRRRQRSVQGTTQAGSAGNTRRLQAVAHNPSERQEQVLGMQLQLQQQQQQQQQQPAVASSTAVAVQDIGADVSLGRQLWALWGSGADDSKADMGTPTARRRRPRQAAAEQQQQQQQAGGNGAKRRRRRRGKGRKGRRRKRSGAGSGHGAAGAAGADGALGAGAAAHGRASRSGSPADSSPIAAEGSGVVTRGNLGPTGPGSSSSSSNSSSSSSSNSSSLQSTRDTGSKVWEAAAHAGPLALSLSDAAAMYKGKRNVYEKNWMPFVWQDRLLVVHSVSPEQRVYELQPNGTARLRHVTPTGSVLSKLGQPLHKLHGGPPVVLISSMPAVPGQSSNISAARTLRAAADSAAIAGGSDSNSAGGSSYYLGVLHYWLQGSGDRRRYHHFLYKLALQPPFNVLQVSQELPLRYSAHFHHVAFASGLHYSAASRQLLISYGSGDWESHVLEMGLSEVEALFDAAHN